VSEEARELVAQLVVAPFPDEVKRPVSGKTNPCDDFYEFSCGTWTEENRHKIPKYKSSVGLAWNQASHRIRDAMEKLFETDTGPVGTYYKSCMDLAHVNEQGAEPLKPWLAVVDGITDREGLVRAVAVFNKNNLDNLFSWYVGRDPTQDDTRAFFLTQGSVTLPDKAYYTEDSAEMREHRATLEERVGHLFKLIGRDKPEEEAKLVMKLETAIADALDERVVARGDHGTVVTWEEVGQKTPEWMWKEWLEELAACSDAPDGGASMCPEGGHPAVLQAGKEGGKPLLMENVAFFQKLDKILKEHSLDSIKALMRWKVVHSAGPSLSEEFLDSLVQLQKDIYGIQQKSPRPRKCYYSTLETTAWPAAKLYADQVFHRPNVGAAGAMLEEIRTQFSAALKEEEWMAESDRAAAETKLREMFFQVGVPTDKDGKEDWPEQTTALDGLLGHELYPNEMVGSRLSIQMSLRDLTQKPNRRKWGGSTPTAVNAFYGATNNGLWIPAGILQSPFFDIKNEEARNYGCIGAVLGHEMSHGFDDNGRQYNAKGELQDWWSPATVKGFKQGSTCIANLFDTYSIKGRHVQGKLTLGEDIADSGGIKFAYQAFEASGKRTDADRRLFFTAFAQTWCSVQKTKNAVAEMLSDVHAPNKFRVLGALSQFQPFADAFKCPTGSPMSPKDKCSLW